MSQTLEPNFPNEVIKWSPYGITLAYGTTVPTDATAGYAPGCQFIDVDAAAGLQFFINRGSNTSCSFKALDTGGLSLAALTSTATELNQLHSQAQPKFVSGNTPVVVAAATTTLTLTPALHAGRIVTLAPTGGLAITPPAATGTGDVYELILSAAVTGGSLTIDPKAGAAADVVYGWLQTYKATTFTPYTAAPGVANVNLITLNGTTTGGGAIGDWVRLTDSKLNQWKIEGFTVQSGSIATPFSNH